MTRTRVDHNVDVTILRSVKKRKPPVLIAWRSPDPCQVVGLDQVVVQELFVGEAPAVELDLGHTPQ